MLVEVEGVRVHGEEREPGVVEVADRPTRPVLDHLARREVLQVATHPSPYRNSPARGQAACFLGPAAQTSSAPPPVGGHAPVLSTLGWISRLARRLRRPPPGGGDPCRRELATHPRGKRRSGPREPRSNPWRRSRPGR